MPLIRDKVYSNLCRSEKKYILPYNYNYNCRNSKHITALQIQKHVLKQQKLYQDLHDFWVLRWVTTLW